jgi:hypothetical protein
MLFLVHGTLNPLWPGAQSTKPKRAWIPASSSTPVFIPGMNVFDKQAHLVFLTEDSIWQLRLQRR